MLTADTAVDKIRQPCYPQSTGQLGQQYNRRAFMSWILWIIFGAIVGWIATTMTGTRSGLLMNIVVGILGAFVGGLILMYVRPPGDEVMFEVSSVIASIIGAIIVVYLVRMVRRTA
jgi:uncharacterized membrane protein YeaQ/YmgE (transglycosylase-associated protein family)